MFIFYVGLSGISLSFKRVIVQLLSGVDVVLATTTGASPEGPIRYEMCGISPE